jgi:RNA polymerase sigma-70 factor (ECF subfamily)
LTKGEFKHIYDKYFDIIRNYLYYRSGNLELANDITQETFIKVWEKQFDYEEGKIKSLLYKIAGDNFVSHYLYCKNGKLILIIN